MKRFEHGGDVWHGDPKEWLDYSSNINAYGCPDFMQRAFIKAMDEVSLYPQVSMTRAAQGISRLLGMPEECILPTNGGIGALDLVIAKLRPKRVIALMPSFVEYERISLQHRIEFVGVSMLSERHYLQFPMDELRKELQSGDMLVVCNPVNPVGFGISRDVMQQALELVKSRQATLLVDEAFTLFCDGLSIADWVQSNSEVLIAGSLTKIFAMPGVRIGYILAQKDRIADLSEYQTPWVLSAFATCAAEAAPESTEYILKTKENLMQTRAKLKEELEAFSLYIYESCANYLLVDLKPAGVTAAQVSELLRDERILVRSCENYHGLDKYHMRIAVKNHECNDKLICELKCILQEKGKP